MNAFFKKEIRLLLPNLVICCALALPNLAFQFNTDGSLLNGWSWTLSFGCCAATTVMLALNSFGMEISAGTFSNLLAQPIPRQKIWDTKILLLTTALGLLGIFWSACGLVRLAMIGHELHLLDLFTGLATFGMVVFSGSLWTVLLLRQVAAAFWFTLLVPGILMVLIIALFGGHSDEFITGMTVSVLGLYSLGGFLFARWLFLRAQDVQWSGGTIVMPEMRGLGRFKAAGARRTWRPHAALWKKEFQLHQSQYVMAFVLLILHLLVIAARNLCDLHGSPDIKFVLEIFWGLWLVMPLLIGCAAVAEERKLGTLEAQLCLPVKRREQFTRKLIVTMGLSIVLGFLVPLLLEGTRILPNNALHISTASANFAGSWKIWLLNIIAINGDLLPVLTMIGLTLLIALISFYASSVARNTLQTLAPAVLGILFSIFLLIAAADAPWQEMYHFLWHGPLFYFIFPPIIVLTLIRLAFGNFQHVRPHARLLWRNALSLLLAVVGGIGLTSAVYHRAWEKLTPTEPPHGPAQLTLANPASFTFGWGAEHGVRLPDGRIWLNDYAADVRTVDPVATLFANFKLHTTNGTFLSGSNWLTVQRGSREFVGLKTDGSLWVSESPWQVMDLPHGAWKFQQKGDAQKLVQFGNETNWASVDPFGLSVFLVKKDGTLWRWGAPNFDSRKKNWPGLRAYTPYQLGRETNWAAVFFSDYRHFFRKTDGRLWTWDDGGMTNGQTRLELEPGLRLTSQTNFGREKFLSTTRIQYGLQYKIGVREDGTFRVWANQRVVKSSNQRYGEYQWFPTDLQIGSETNWLAVAGDWNQVITLKKDGTLWSWDFRAANFRQRWEPRDLESEIQHTRPVRLGTHADWIAISGTTALAADGNLWYWPLGRSDDYYDSHNNPSAMHPLLDISHKPQWLGNVLH